ncbi:nuclear transport factor 2 family protein [Ensifer sp. ENS10]|jgi:hypothetical protein|uniref:nuclear transport factor 2 family protein n=1 Tax=Sinorhizobium/Ensifer group TaxID=227292 RepID=UPI00070D4DE1|nr:MULTISPECIES: nuclear transport factor 2 family protein [Sinorhizobium/Ensifer group]KRD64152.1 hypothetical protein ASE60_03255 [Ensifer sp. Root278]KSV85214.1 hypothetical protein N183_01900 [Sinorhizobium sp. Sb3]MBD9506104.1 nuclear transport factor 2 family protein [Ensifer sp. ENS10]
MSGAPNDPQFAAIVEVLQGYFDGLYRSDTSILKQVFHPKALYATATDGTLLELDMDRYFPVVDKRPSPESRGEERADRILSIEFAGPVTALAKVQCAIGEKAFTDLLSLVFVDGRWQIIAKVFHYDIKPAK